MNSRNFHKLCCILISCFMATTQVVPSGYAELVQIDETGTLAPVIPVEDVVIEEENNLPDPESHSPLGLPTVEARNQERLGIVINDGDENTDHRVARIRLKGDTTGVKYLRVAVNSMDEDAYGDLIPYVEGEEVEVEFSRVQGRHWFNVEICDENGVKKAWDFGSLNYNSKLNMKYTADGTMITTKRKIQADIFDEFREMSQKAKYFRYNVNDLSEERASDFMENKPWQEITLGGNKGNIQWANFWFYDEDFKKIEEDSFKYSSIRLERLDLQMTLSGGNNPSNWREVDVDFTSQSDALEDIAYVRFSQNRPNVNMAGEFQPFSPSMKFEIKGPAGRRKWVNAWVYDKNKKLLGFVYSSVVIQKPQERVQITPINPERPPEPDFPMEIEINGKKVKADIKGLVTDLKTAWEKVKQEPWDETTPRVISTDAMASLLKLKGVKDLFSSKDLLRFDRDEPYCPPGAPCVAWTPGEWPFSKKGWIDFSVELIRRMDENGLDIYVPELTKEQSIKAFVPAGDVRAISNVKVMKIVNEGIPEEKPEPEFPTEIEVNGKKVIVNMEELADDMQEARRKAEEEKIAETGQHPIEGFGIESWSFLPGVAELFPEGLGAFETDGSKHCFEQNGVETCVQSSLPPQFTTQGMIDFLTELIRRMDNKGLDIFKAPETSTDSTTQTASAVTPDPSASGHVAPQGTIHYFIARHTALNAEKFMKYVVEGIEPKPTREEIAEELVAEAKQEIERIFRENQIEGPINLADYDEFKASVRRDLWNQIQEILKALRAKLEELGWGETPSPVEPIMPAEPSPVCAPGEICANLGGQVENAVGVYARPDGIWGSNNWPQSAKDLEAFVNEQIKVHYAKFLSVDFIDPASGVVIPMQLILERVRKEYYEAVGGSGHSPEDILKVFPGLDPDSVPNHFSWGGLRYLVSKLFRVNTFHQTLDVVTAFSTEQLRDMMVAFYRANRGEILGNSETFNVERFFDLLKGTPEPEYPTHLKFAELGIIITQLDMKGLIDALKEARREAEMKEMESSGAFPIHGHPMTSLLLLKGIADVFTAEEIMDFEMTKNTHCFETANGLSHCTWTDATPQFTKQGWIDFTTELIYRYAKRDLDIFKSPLFKTVEVLPGEYLENATHADVQTAITEDPTLIEEPMPYPLPPLMRIVALDEDKFMKVVKEGIEEIEDPAVTAMRKLVSLDLVNTFGFEQEEVERLINAGLIDFIVDVENKKVIVKLDPSVRGSHTPFIHIVENLSDPVGSAELPLAIHYELGEGPQMGAPCIGTDAGDLRCPPPVFQLEKASYRVGDLQYRLDYLNPGPIDLDPNLAVPRTQWGTNRLQSVEVVRDQHIVCVTTPCDPVFEKIKTIYFGTNQQGQDVARIQYHQDSPVANRQVIMRENGNIDTIIDYDENRNVIAKSQFIYLMSIVLYDCIEGAVCTPPPPTEHFSHIIRTDANGNKLSEIMSVEVAPIQVDIYPPRIQFFAKVRLSNGSTHVVLFRTLEDLLPSVMKLEEVHGEFEVAKARLLKKTDVKIEEVQEKISELQKRLEDAKRNAEARTQEFKEDFERSMSELEDLLEKLTKIMESANVSPELQEQIADFLEAAASSAGELPYEEYIEFLRFSYTFEAQILLNHQKDFLGQLEEYRIKVDQAQTLEEIEKLGNHFPQPGPIAMPAIRAMNNPIQTLSEIIEKGKRLLMVAEEEKEVELIRQALLETVDESLRHANAQIERLEASIANIIAMLEEEIAILKEELEAGILEAETLIEKIKTFTHKANLPAEIAEAIADFLKRAEPLIPDGIQKMAEQYIAGMRKGALMLLEIELDSWKEYARILKNYRAKVEGAATLEDLEELGSQFPEYEPPLFPSTSSSAVTGIEAASLLEDSPATPMDILSRLIQEAKEILRKANAYQSLETFREKLLIKLDGKIREIEAILEGEREHLAEFKEREKVLIAELEKALGISTGNLEEVVRKIKEKMETMDLGEELAERIADFLSNANELLSGGIEELKAERIKRITQSSRQLQSQINIDEEYLEKLIALRKKVEEAETMEALEELSEIPERPVIAFLTVIYPAVDPVVVVDEMVEAGKNILDELNGRFSTPKAIQEARIQIEALLAKLQIQGPVSMTEVHRSDELFDEVHQLIRKVLNELADELRKHGWGRPVVPEGGIPTTTVIDFGPIEWPQAAIDLERQVLGALREAYHRLNTLPVRDREATGVILNMEHLIAKFRDGLGHELQFPKEMLSIYPGLTSDMIPEQFEFPPSFRVRAFNEYPHLIVDVFYLPLPSERQTRDILIAFFESVREKVVRHVASTDPVQEQAPAHPWFDEELFWELLTGGEARQLQKAREALLKRIDDEIKMTLERIEATEEALEASIERVTQQIEELMKQVEDGKLGLESILEEILALLGQIGSSRPFEVQARGTTTSSTSNEFALTATELAGALAVYVTLFGSVEGDDRYDPNYDLNQDGGINVADRILLTGRTENLSEEEQKQFKSFLTFDQNNDFMLTAEELAAALAVYVTLFGSVEGDDRYDPNYDLNQDGGINVADRILLTSLNEFLSEAEQQKFQSFLAFDQNNDFVLTKEEMAAAFEVYVPLIGSMEGDERYDLNFDLNHDGGINVADRILLNSFLENLSDREEPKHVPFVGPDSSLVYIQNMRELLASIDGIAEDFATALMNIAIQSHEFDLKALTSHLEALENYRKEVEDADSLKMLRVLEERFPELRMVRPAIAISLPEDPREVLREAIAEGEAILQRILQKELKERAEAIQDATEKLIGAFNFTTVSEDEIEVVVAEKMTWSNGCVGFAAPNMACTMAIVTGYRIVLELHDNLYEFHAGRMNPAKIAAIAAIQDAVEVEELEFGMIKIVTALSEIREFDTTSKENAILRPTGTFQVILTVDEVHWYHYIIDYFTMEILEKFESVNPSWEEPGTGPVDEDLKKRVFRLFDVDGDGDISEEEVYSGIAAIDAAFGVAESAVSETEWFAVAGYDINGDGIISLEDLIGISAVISQIQSELTPA